MSRIIFATGNAGKMREIREILADMNMEILSMKEAGINAEIDEDGTTFEENAIIKAKAIAKLTNDIVLADDSGLEVDYLNKEPGIYSARYMGEDTSYTVKNQAIIDRLEGVPKEKRTARFVCAIAAVLPNEKCLQPVEQLRDTLVQKAPGRMVLAMILFFTWMNMAVPQQKYPRNRKMKSAIAERLSVQ